MLHGTLLKGTVTLNAPSEQRLPAVELRPLTGWLSVRNCRIALRAHDERHVHVWLREGLPKTGSGGVVTPGFN